MGGLFLTHFWRIWTASSFSFCSDFIHSFGNLKITVGKSILLCTLSNPDSAWPCVTDALAGSTSPRGVDGIREVLLPLLAKDGGEWARWWFRWLPGFIFLFRQCRWVSRFIQQWVVWLWRSRQALSSIPLNDFDIGEKDVHEMEGELASTDIRHQNFIEKFFWALRGGMMTWWHDEVVMFCVKNQTFG